MPMRLLFLLHVLALGACERLDPCLESAQTRTASPSGRRVATVYAGGCPGVFLAPQVTVDFRGPQGSGGAGVFAVRDSAADIRVRWRGEDTLEITYPPGATVEKRDTLARLRRATVHVVYRSASSE